MSTTKATPSTSHQDKSLTSSSSGSAPRKSARTSSSRSRCIDPEEEDLSKVVDMMDRRRLQNRISQRNYRHKIRTRLEKIESLLGPEAAAELDKPTPTRSDTCGQREDAAPGSPSVITVRGRSSTRTRNQHKRPAQSPDNASNGELDDDDDDDGGYARSVRASPFSVQSPSRTRPPLLSTASGSSGTSNNQRAVDTSNLQSKSKPSMD